MPFGGIQTAQNNKFIVLNKCSDNYRILRYFEVKIIEFSDDKKAETINFNLSLEPFGTVNFER